MSRRSIIKDTEEEMIQDAQVVMRWSKKRIGIATIIVVLIIAGGIYALSLIGQNTVGVLGTTANSDSPKIKIPDQNGVQDILENAKKDLSNINAKNLVDSQPALRKIINDLTHLTGSSTSARDLICDSICR